MSICICIGHGKSSSGAYDPGAVNGDCHEFQIAREIGKYAADYYNENYAEKCDLINYDGTYFLNERYNLANKNKYDFVAEIHLNAGGGTGCEVFRSVKNDSGAAAVISAAIASAFGIPDRGAKVKTTSSGTDYFGILRETKMQAVLIETVFIDNDSDLELVKSVSGQKKMGQVIAKSIAKSRGIKPLEKPGNGEDTGETDGEAATASKDVYRVQAGNFREKAGADRLAKKLKAEGFDAFVIKGETS